MIRKGKKLIGSNVRNWISINWNSRRDREWKVFYLITDIGAFFLRNFGPTKAHGKGCWVRILSQGILDGFFALISSNMRVWVEKAKKRPRMWSNSQKWKCRNMLLRRYDDVWSDCRVGAAPFSRHRRTRLRRRNITANVVSTSKMTMSFSRRQQVEEARVVFRRNLTTLSDVKCVDTRLDVALTLQPSPPGRLDILVPEFYQIIFWQIVNLV